MSPHPKRGAQPALLPDRARRRQVLALSLPIIGGMTSQNVLNLVDTWMVGALGPASLAGVGLSSFINFMAVAVITGLAAAVQATAARRFGENRLQETAVPLNGGLLLSLAIGIPLSLLLIAAAPGFYGLLNSDPDVVREGTVYLQWRLLAVAAIGMNFSFRGYWSAVNLARLYLFTLLWMHALNIVISYVLIFGKLGFPALGVAGAGIGTTVSIFIGTATYFALAWRHARGAGFLRRSPDPAHLGRLLRLALPTCVQQLLFAAGFTALFWIVGQVGTDELAVANVLTNLMLLAVLPGIGFGLAAASLTSHALGRGDTADAARWPWDVYRVALPAYGLLAAVMVLLPDPILTTFLRDPELVALGRLPLQLVGLGVLLDGLGLILMHGLLGAGASGFVMTVVVGMQWLVFLPAAYLLGPVLGLGLTAIWLTMMGYRGLQAVAFIVYWRAGGWRTIQV